MLGLWDRNRWRECVRSRFKSPYIRVWQRKEMPPTRWIYGQDQATLEQAGFPTAVMIQLHLVGALCWRNLISTLCHCHQSKSLQPARPLYKTPRDVWAAGTCSLWGRITIPCHEPTCDKSLSHSKVASISNRSTWNALLKGFDQCDSIDSLSGK